MRKNIYIYLAMLPGICNLSSCTEEAGTEPGNDSMPSAIVYQYKVTAEDGDYDPDVDVRIRIAANSATSEVYYLAERTAAKDSAVEAGGEEAYMRHVVEAGSKAALAGGTADVILTGLLHDNTITVVAKGANGMLASQETSFFGIYWKDVCEGRIKAPLLDETLDYTWSTGNVTLQQRDDSSSVYRIKNAYGKGYDIVLAKGSETYNEGEDDFFGMAGENFSTVRMPAPAPTPYSYGEYGPVSLSDAGDDYAGYCRMYDGYFIFVYSACTVSAGRLTDYDFFQFSPAE